MGNRQAEFFQGTLEMVILRLLEDGRVHGYGLARRIREQSGEVFIVKQGSLYPALYRMERRQWIQSEWGSSEQKRRVKYYRLTSQGRKRLKQVTTEWHRNTSAIHQLLGLALPEG